MENNILVDFYNLFNIGVIILGVIGLMLLMIATSCYHISSILKDKQQQSRSNEKVIADLRGALTPFFNLPEVMTAEIENIGEDEYYKLLKENAETCNKLKPRILELLKSIE